MWISWGVQPPGLKKVEDETLMKSWMMTLSCSWNCSSKFWQFLYKVWTAVFHLSFRQWEFVQKTHAWRHPSPWIKIKKMKRRSSSETLPWYVTNHRGEPPMVPHLVAGGLRPRSPPPTPHSANTLPINAIFKFPVNFFLWTAGLWWSRHL